MIGVRLCLCDNDPMWVVNLSNNTSFDTKRGEGRKRSLFNFEPLFWDLGTVNFPYTNVFKGVSF